MNVPTKPARSPLLSAFTILLILAGAAVAVSSFASEMMWFDALSFGQVFRTQIGMQIALFGVAFVIMGGFIMLNMYLAFRFRPVARRRGASAILDRYRDLLEKNLRVAMLVPAVVIGGMGGLSASTQWLKVLAWLNRSPSGVIDPTFNVDVSFFMLEYPVWRLGISLLLSATVFGLIAAAAVHFAVGNLVTGRPKAASKAPALVARHLSVVAAIAMVLYGAENLLDRYGLMLTRGPVFTGLQFTDDHARMTAKLVIAIIAFLIAALFVANAFINKLMIPIVGVVLLVVSGLVLSAIYPWGVQTFTVKPNEPDKERPYIAKHITATREAFAIDNVSIEDYPAVTNVSSGQLREDAAALPGIRLMDPAVIAPTFDQLQQVRGYYSFPKNLAVDRYQIDGKETDVVVAARELKLSGIPDRTNWNNVHTVYTHGHGFVSAYGNRRKTNGEPEWITRDIPTIGKIPEKQSRIYYGQESTEFAIVGRMQGQNPIELDTPGGGSGGGESYNVYDGAGGVPMGTPLARAMFAIKFGDLNILLSDRVNTVSKILFDRTPEERVSKVAPWLKLDKNVYPALVEGRLVWIVDAYTTSATYPNSQSISLADATSDAQTKAVGAQVDENINYIRNSVKAVVDAYDGTVSLYAWDANDPLLKAYSSAFPGTVKPKSDIPAELLAHFRYPEDLFKVQRQMLGRYHMTDPGAWYQQSDLWEIPADPTQKNAQTKEPPYYLSIRWPKETKPVFSLTSVFVPKMRQNLASYLAVNADAASPDYGKLRVLRMSDTHQIDGPGQTFNAIATDAKVAQLLRNYTSMGAADAQYGNLLTLPVGGGLLYVQPIFTVRTGNAGAYPALTYVVVRFGQHVGIGTTLQEALDQVFQGDAGASTGETTQPATAPPGGTVTPAPTPTPAPGVSVNDPVAAKAAIEAAEAAMQAADVALKQGDLAGYQAKVNEAKANIAKALSSMGR